MTCRKYYAFDQNYLFSHVVAMSVLFGPGVPARAARNQQRELFHAREKIYHHGGLRLPGLFHARHPGHCHIAVARPVRVAMEYGSGRGDAGHRLDRRGQVYFGVDLRRAFRPHRTQASGADRRGRLCAFLRRAAAERQPFQRLRLRLSGRRGHLGPGRLFLPGPAGKFSQGSRFGTGGAQGLHFPVRHGLPAVGRLAGERGGSRSFRLECGPVGAVGLQRFGAGALLHRSFFLR